MPLLYDLGIRAYQAGLRLAALYHPKARQWVAGRKDWRAGLARAMEALPQPTAGRLWVHCASVGEFEQGRPVIERLKARQPRLQVVLSFFSPSGYTLRRDFHLADHVCYLPLDTVRNAADFLDIVRPEVVLFVKYEFWLHHLRTVQRRGIPLLLVSGIFRKGQVFFQPWGGPFRRLLRGFTHLFIQDEASAALLEGIGVDQYAVVGDTRVDRVAGIARNSEPNEVVAAFVGDAPVLVAGSTWPADERLLQKAIAAAWPSRAKVILAPHEVDAGHLQAVEERFPGAVIRYSGAAKNPDPTAPLLLIDNVGLLAGLYRYGKVAYVGGGFGAGIHNILEPVAFGLPVIFGPRHRKFREARDLLARGAAFAVTDAHSLEKTLRDLQDDGVYEAAARAARTYIEANRGATEAVVAFIHDRGLLGPMATKA